MTESHVSTVIGETVCGMLSLQGHYANSIMKHIPSLSVKKANLLVLQLQLDGEPPSQTHIWSLQKNL